MVDGQNGRLEIVQPLVLKSEPDFAIILYHHVRERTAMAQQ